MARPATRTFKLPKGPGSALAHALARNVVASRLAEQLSQEALATKAGLSARTLQRVERHEVIADLETLAQLAEALGVPAAQLLA